MGTRVHSINFIGAILQDSTLLLLFILQSGHTDSNFYSILAKRKRTILDESEERSLSDYSITSSAKGDVEILDADPEGKFVKLHNKSNKVLEIKNILIAI